MTTVVSQSIKVTNITSSENGFYKTPIGIIRLILIVRMF
jgi:hypothetical protein